MPKISVILPVYNVEKYIRQCLDSLINQTFKDLEIICVDDNSEDNSLNIIKEYAQRDNRFIIIEKHARGGVGEARNTGLLRASGEYISFIDPDDWIELNTYEEISKKINELNPDAICFNIAIFAEYRKINIKKDLQDLKNFYSKEDLLKENYLTFGGSACNKVIKHSILKENNIFFPHSSLQEDGAFNLIVLAIINNLYCIDKSFYIYRLREKSITHTLDYNHINAAENINFIRDFLIKHNLFNKENQEKLNEYKLSIIKSIFYLIPYEKRKNYLESCKQYFNEKEYEDFLKSYKKEYKKKEMLFSIKNEYDLYSHKKFKVITLCGKQFKFLVKNQNLI